MTKSEILSSSRKLVEKILELYRQESMLTCRYDHKIEAASCSNVKFLAEYSSSIRSLLDVYSSEIGMSNGMYMKGV